MSHPDGQPIADHFDEAVRRLVDQYRLSGISVAETVGVLAILQHDLIREANERERGDG